MGKNVPLYLYGNGLTDKTEVIFTSAKGKISFPRDAFHQICTLKRNTLERGYYFSNKDY